MHESWSIARVGVHSVCLLTALDSVTRWQHCMEWFYMSSLHNVFCSSGMELTEIRTKYVHGNRLAALMHVHRLWYTWSSKLNTNVHSNNSLDSLINVNLATVTALHRYFSVQSTHPRLRCYCHTFHLFPLSLTVFLAACNGHAWQCVLLQFKGRMVTSDAYCTGIWTLNLLQCRGIDLHGEDGDLPPMRPCVVSLLTKCRSSVTFGRHVAQSTRWLPTGWHLTHHLSFSPVSFLSFVVETCTIFTEHKSIWIALTLICSTLYLMCLQQLQYNTC